MVSFTREAPPSCVNMPAHPRRGIPSVVFLSIYNPNSERKLEYSKVAFCYHWAGISFIMTQSTR